MKSGTTVRLIFLSLVVTVAVGSITACSQSPQQKYEHADKELQQAQKNRAQVQKAVGEKEEDLAKSQRKLNEGEDNLQTAQQQVQQASQAVNKTVSDDLLFRTLQGKLVDKDNFDHSAISVAVHDRVVTLSGTVPDQETQQRALKIAHSQAGVEQVIDHLQIMASANKQGDGGKGNASPGNA